MTTNDDSATAAAPTIEAKTEPTAKKPKPKGKPRGRGPKDGRKGGGALGAKRRRVSNDKDRQPHPKDTITLAKINIVCQALAAGAYVETAVAHAGISRQNYYNWMSRAARGEGTALHRLLFDKVQKALADGELRHILNIVKAAEDGTWQASAWMLERKFPHRWGRRLGVEHTGAGGGALQLDVRRQAVSEIMKDPEMLKAANLLAERLVGVDWSAADTPTIDVDASAVVGAEPEPPEPVGTVDRANGNGKDPGYVNGNGRA